MKPTTDPVLVRPSSVHVVPAPGGRYVCYNSLAGECVVANGSARRLLDRFARPVHVQSLPSRCHDDSVRDTVALFEMRRLLLPRGIELRDRFAVRLDAHLLRVAEGRVLRNLTLVVNEACNFSCTYCMENAMLRAGGRPGEQGRRMSAETLDVALRGYFGLLRDNGRRSCEIGFSGGEPLFNWPLVRTAMAEATRIGRDFGLRGPVRFGLNTNASLLTPEIAAEIGCYPVRALTVGIDGLQAGSDQVRRYRNGRGTFDAVLRGLRTARQHIRAIIGVNAVLTRETWPYITNEFLTAMDGEGVDEVTIEPDLVACPDGEVEEIAGRLVDLFECGQRIGVNVTGNWLRPALQLRRGSGISMFHCLSQGGGNITVTSTGQVAACAYCSPSFGHIADLRRVLRSPAYLQFIRSRFNSAIAACRGCAIEGVCAGGCYASVDGRPRDPRRCALYQRVAHTLLARWA